MKAVAGVGINGDVNGDVNVNVNVIPGCGRMVFVFALALVLASSSICELCKKLVEGRGDRDTRVLVWIVSVIRENVARRMKP